VLETELVPVWFPSPLLEPFFAVMEAPCPCTAAAYSCWVWRCPQHVIETICSDKEKMIEGGAWGRDCAAATGEKIWGKSRVAPLVGQNRRFCAQLGQHIHANAIVELGTVYAHPSICGCGCLHAYLVSRDCGPNFNIGSSSTLVWNLPSYSGECLLFPDTMLACILAFSMDNQSMWMIQN
jgi:hypothetical protein